MRYYLLVIYNCVTPVTFGPYKTERDRELEAIALVKDNRIQLKEDCIFRLDIGKEHADVGMLPEYLFEETSHERKRSEVL